MVIFLFPTFVSLIAQSISNSLIHCSCMSRPTSREQTLAHSKLQNENTTRTKVGDTGRCCLCTSLSARSIGTAGWCLFPPAPVLSHCSTRACLYARQTQASIKSTLTPPLTPRCAALLWERSASAHSRRGGRRADPLAEPNRPRWQMCHGNNSPCHLFFGASWPNPSASVLRSRTGWNTSPIMGLQLIMHYQLVPLATDRCLAGGTRPFCSFRTILSSSPLILLFPSVH